MPSDKRRHAHAACAINGIDWFVVCFDARGQWTSTSCMVDRDTASRVAELINRDARRKQQEEGRDDAK
jgi:hypothetical protein